MAIAKLKPTSEVPQQPAPVTVEKSHYKDVVVDHKEEPIESMVAYLAGMPWTVNYYPQLLGEHSDLRELDPGANAAFQQYSKIIGIELRVDSPISSSYDTEGGITTVQGSAILTCHTPNIKDYFVAEAGHGELGLFNITNVERMTFGRGSVWRIDYALVGYARDEAELYNDLESKVVSTYYFSKERLVEGLSPVLREEDYMNSQTLAFMYHSTIRRFFKTFFNRTARLLLTPNKETCYDHGLNNFLCQIIDSSEAEEMQDIKFIPVDHDRYLNRGNLWTVLLNREYSDVARVYQKSVLAPRSYFGGNSWMPGAAYWNAAWFVYPRVESDELAILGYNQPFYSGTSKFIEGAATMELPTNAGENSYNTGDAVVPKIKSVLIDDYYVLSEAFYTNKPNLSALEILTRDYLKGNTIDLYMLASLVKSAPDWPALEQFYYVPILILLMKDAIKGFYK